MAGDGPIRVSSARNDAELCTCAADRASSARGLHGRAIPARSRRDLTVVPPRTMRTPGLFWFISATARASSYVTPPITHTMTCGARDQRMRGRSGRARPWCWGAGRGHLGRCSALRAGRRLISEVRVLRVVDGPLEQRLERTGEVRGVLRVHVLHALEPALQRLLRARQPRLVVEEVAGAARTAVVREHVRHDALGVLRARAESARGRRLASRGRPRVAWFGSMRQSSAIRCVGSRSYRSA